MFPFFTKWVLHPVDFPAIISFYLIISSIGVIICLNSSTLTGSI